MTRSRLDAAAFTFKAGAEALHEKFLAILKDSACAECRSSGFGEAILATWLQNSWGRFSRELVVASAQGTRRRRGMPFRAISGVRSQADAEKAVRAAASCIATIRGSKYPIWHDPSFSIAVGTVLDLQNLPIIEIVLGATFVPRQITAFRNYLIHPGNDTRQKYEKLQSQLGMLHAEPEDLLHQFRRPGLTVFTSWVRDLQRVADDSTK